MNTQHLEWENMELQYRDGDWVDVTKKQHLEEWEKDFKIVPSK